MDKVSLEQFFSTQLRRSLEPEESEILGHITAAGIAKINYDFGKGLPVAQTIDELKVVYEKMKHRRTLIENSISTEAKSLLSKLQRKPSSDELAMFAYMPVESLRASIAAAEKMGDTYENIIEDLALQYKHLQLRCDGVALAKEKGLALYFNRLIPTELPPVLEEQCSSIAKVSDDKVQVGFSPHTVWFQDAASDKDKVSFHISSDESVTPKRKSPKCLRRSISFQAAVTAESEHEKPELLTSDSCPPLQSFPADMITAPQESLPCSADSERIADDSPSDTACEFPSFSCTNPKRSSAGLTFSSLKAMLF